MASGYDKVFEFAPQFGKYQLYVFICAYLASCFIYGPMLTAGVYFQYEPEFRCKSQLELSEGEDYVMDQSILDMLLLPVDKKQPSHSQCHIYHHEIQQGAACENDIEGSATNELMNEKMNIDTVTTMDSNVEKHFINGTGCLVISKDQHDTCSEYVFSKEFVNISVTTENNLVCKNGWIDELLTVAAMVGMIIGPTVSGMVSDRIGRIMSIVLFCFISFGFALVNGCLGSYHWGIYGVFRLLSVFGSSGIGITYFVVIMESIGDRYRPRLGLLYITTTIGVGTVLLSFITMALRKWQHVQFVLAGFCCIIAFLTRTIMETPRWLYAHDKYEQARTNVRKMASWSGMEIEEKTFDEFETEMKKADEEAPMSTGGVRDLFRSARIRETTIIIMLNQFVRGIINYGFLFNIGGLGGNIYYNNIINNLTGIPAFLMLCCTVDNKWLGRKGNFVMTLWLAGLSSYLIFFGKLFENTQLVNICSYLGMFASTAATSVGYVYTAEVYPTEIRNVGVGCSSSAAMAGALCAPLMKLLGDVVWWLPPMINGTLALCAGALSFWLPETNNQPMTTTIDEFETKYARGATTTQIEDISGLENEGYDENHL
jgi:MFS family permease